MRIRHGIRPEREMTLADWDQVNSIGSKPATFACIYENYVY